MGTRSTTIILDGNSELCRVYRQMDGYPDGHGVELAELCNVTLINGIGPGCHAGTHANGMGCLAAQIISKLKDDIGGIYLEPTGGEINDWVEYVYTVRNLDGKVVMQCTTQTGPFPFNVQTEEATVFTGTPAEFLAKFKAKANT